MNELTAFVVSFPASLLISLLFDGIDRKLHARMQKRIGPPIIQPIYDLIKLFSKERIIPITASARIFETMPIISASTSLLAASIVLSNIIAEVSVVGDLILVIYLLAVASIALMIGGSASGNPYSAIGFSRKISMIIAYEIPMFISVISIALGLSPTLTINGIIRFQSNMRAPSLLLRLSAAIAAAAFMICVPAAASVVPFDIPEAKTEIIYGFLVEYGGPYLALAKIAKASSNFTLTLLAATIFLYTPSFLGVNASQISLLLCLATSLAVMFITITLPRTIFARLKVGQAFRFYWMLPLTLSTISAILSVVGF